VRANRQMGIRTTHLLRAASDDYQLSPLAPISQMQPVDEQDSFDSSIRPSPISKSTRMLTSDLPMSITSSSASLDYTGTSASASLADSSMISLLSTAPTSIPPGSTTSEEAGQGARKGSRERDDEEEEEGEQDQMDSLTSSDQRRDTSIAGDNSSLELRHLSFLLNVAPHTVVEPLGLGTQERLLAPDWTVADEDALRDQEWTNEGMLLRESVLAATSKMSSLPLSTAQPRSVYIIDQLAPVRLFDRRTLVEMQALHNSNGNRSTKGGLSLPGSTAATAKAQALEGDGEENKSIVQSTFPTRNYTNGHHHHRGLDPHLYDVVDPVALLGSLVN
jgi:transcriptional coactivator HFI1/ADA1